MELAALYIFIGVFVTVDLAVDSYVAGRRWEWSLGPFGIITVLLWPVVLIALSLEGPNADR